MQVIINTATHPIVEYQADPNSFAYRPQRMARDAIALLVGHLEQSGNRKKAQNELPVKVSKGMYDQFKGKRLRKRMGLINPGVSLRKREYLYDYWICGQNKQVSEQKSNINPFTFTSNYHIINVDIKKCFDNIDQRVILKKFPLCSKYRFLKKA